MTGAAPAGFLAKYGEALIRAGYKIVPIKRGTKRPPFDNWEKADGSLDQLNAWLSGEFETTNGKEADGKTPKPFTYRAGRLDGVGILTGREIGVDLDIKNEEVVSELQAFVEFMLGEAPVRVGQPPKRLLVFRSERPFPKVQSSFWVDEWDDKHKVEILADGQQFVCAAIHPDTGKPYQWVKGSPLKTSAADLPVITEQDARAIVAEFERIAAARGWKRKAGTALARPSTRGPAVGQVDYDDPFASDKSKTEISDEELHRKLLLVPGCEDYDTWLQVGMALYHQFDGDERGRELWHEWSGLASNYDRDGLDTRWDGFDIADKGRAPVTARLILKLAKDHQEVLSTEVLGELERDLREAPDRQTLKKVCDRVKRTEIDQLARESLLGLLQANFKRITGQALRIQTARDMLRFENPESAHLPNWLQGWVYCAYSETFYNYHTHQEVSVPAFNNIHNRHMLTQKDVLEGKSSPEAIASAFALNNKKIPLVQNRMYFPGQGKLFDLNQRPYVNSYDDRNVMQLPEKLVERDRKNVQRVIDHAEHLFAVERDRNLFLDYMAHIVQGHGRIDWAILMQGTEGDGKTFWYRVLAAMLGWENVRNLQAHALEEKYTPWAEGAQVNFFEEIKLHGHNRFDVLNRLKPLITNPTVGVRRMNVDLYSAINVTSYMLTTNYRDALPLDERDSRYFVLISRWQTAADLNDFKRENPHYYRDLHNAVTESAGAIRKWFLERTVSPEFNATGRAPPSAGRKEMVGYSVSSELEALNEILAESGRMDMCSQLLNATDLADEMQGRDCEPPYGKAMNALLLSAGFTRLGKVSIKVAGKNKTPLFWSRTPAKFQTPLGDFDPTKVRAWLDDPL